MKKPLKKTGISKIHWFWTVLFVFWAIFLTGVFSRRTGTPGFIQNYDLKRLLETRLKEVALAERDVQEIQDEFRELKANSDLQEYEIRRVLGYAAPHELIFDFSTVKR